MHYYNERFCLLNKEKLNDENREFLIMSTVNKPRKVNVDDIKIGPVNIKSAKKTKTL